jgi:hypothetical protein
MDTRRQKLKKNQTPAVFPQRDTLRRLLAKMVWAIVDIAFSTYGGGVG